jgi:60 kDa SS-A/Ro ribonucleoprotein
MLDSRYFYFRGGILLARFNESKSGTNKTKNYEGEDAYKLSPEVELYTAVCTANLQPKFYSKDTREELARLRRLIKQVPPEFVANLAIYAREEMYLRSIPLVLVTELAKVHKGDSLVAETATRVIQRADEITELLAYYQLANNRQGMKKLSKLSKGIRKGVQNSFAKFDEYAFGKYNRKSDISFKDAIFLTHPRVTPIMEKIVDGTLETPYTWETQLSERGNTKEVWEELIDSRKVGYMALMRNLRNILEADVSNAHLEKVAGFLGSETAVLRSRQLPFRFYAAYKEIKRLNNPRASFILDALEEAVKHSAANIEGFGLDTSVVLACDVSGSMQMQISPRSSIQNFDIGIILSMLLQSRCKAVTTGMFGDTWKTIQVPTNNILSNADEYHRREGEVGYSTNGYKVIDDLIKKRQRADKVMIFTDCQMWDSNHRGGGFGFYRTRQEKVRHIRESWREYKTKVSPNSKLYLFDLAGYGNTPLDISTKDVYLIAGWSDKVFNALAAIDRGEDVVKQLQ